MSKTGFKLLPKPGKVIVKRDTPAETTGRIITPDKYKRRPTTGLVVAIGPSVEGIEIGDRIIFAQFSGTECGFSLPETPTEVEAFLILSTDEILATIVGEAILQEQGA